MIGMRKYENRQKRDEYFEDIEDDYKGVINILHKYKSNSKLQCYPNWFSTFERELKKPLSNRILYLGNCSDLWGYFQFQVKSLKKILEECGYNIYLIKKYIHLGQLFMIFMAKSKVTSQSSKLSISEMYIKKLNNFRNEIRKNKEMRRRNNSATEDRKQSSCIFPSQNKVASEVEDQFLFEDFTQYNISQNKGNFKNFIKNMIGILRQYLNLSESTKIVHSVFIVCMILLFVLRNEDWTKILLSKLQISRYIFHYLGERDGATRIAKYLNDANIKLQKEEIQVFSQLVF